MLTWLFWSSWLAWNEGEFSVESISKGININRYVIKCNRYYELYSCQGHKGVKGDYGEPGKQGHKVRTLFTKRLIHFTKQEPEASGFMCMCVNVCVWGQHVLWSSAEWIWIWIKQQVCCNEKTSHFHWCMKNNEGCRFECCKNKLVWWHLIHLWLLAILSSRISTLDTIYLNQNFAVHFTILC